MNNDGRPNLRAEVITRVPFHDADPAGVTWHGNYFKYFELARVALFESFGYSYRDMAESGFVWPVVDLATRFLRPTIFEQTIRVSAELTEWEYRLKVVYEIRDAETEELLATAYTTQVPVDINTQELVLGCPETVIERVEAQRKA